MTDFNPYQAGVLFLLVGGNPLPNYVAGTLMAKDDATIYLLHTRGTLGVADRLSKLLRAKRQGLTVISRQVDAAQAEGIVAPINDIAKKIKEGDITSVGLNYTGGTKPMSLHAYDALTKAFPRVSLSYLDARTLKLFVNQAGTPTQKLSVGREVDLTLEEICVLHGYELPPPCREPRYPELYRPLATICATSEGFHQWTGSWDKQKRSKGWLKGDRPLEHLPTLEAYPRLRPIIEAFDRLGGDPGSAARYLGQSCLDSCYKWFNGTWLEEHTLEALATVAKRLGIQSFGRGLKPVPEAPDEREKPRAFDLDLAAIVGYQLFAISCIVSQQTGGETKKHLLELFVRARQLGGDEARVALVTCVSNPQVLKQQVERDWDAEGLIRVFGRRDLRRLDRCLQEWIETANKEVA